MAPRRQASGRSGKGKKDPAYRGVTKPAAATVASGRPRRAAAQAAATAAIDRVLQDEALGENRYDEGFIPPPVAAAPPVIAAPPGVAAPPTAPATGAPQKAPPPVILRLPRVVRPAAAPNVGKIHMPAPLASTTLTQIVQFGRDRAARTGGRLRGTMEVLPDDTTDNGRLCYRANFFLQETDEGPEHVGEKYVGYISAERINKPNGDKPDVQSRWVADFLTANAPDSPYFEDVRACLQALYNRLTGTRRVGLLGPIGTTLDDHALLFVEMVHTVPEYQRQGLNRPMLQMFRSLLGRLPEWFAFQGLDTIILFPGRPGDEKGDCWKNVDDATLAQTLTTIYQNADAYQIITQNAPVAGRGGHLIHMTIMGRHVQ